MPFCFAAYTPMQVPCSIASEHIRNPLAMYTHFSFENVLSCPCFPRTYLPHARTPTHARTQPVIVLGMLWPGAGAVNQAFWQWFVDLFAFLAQKQFSHVCSAPRCQSPTLNIFNRYACTHEYFSISIHTYAHTYTHTHIHTHTHARTHIHIFI